MTGAVGVFVEVVDLAAFGGDVASGVGALVAEEFGHGSDGAGEESSGAAVANGHAGVVGDDGSDSAVDE